jgi:perosamine synthetase
MATTNDTELADKMRRFRNHGIDSDHRRRIEQGTWYYEMVDLGYNYRITDIQCALGLSQLRKLPNWLIRRQEIARQYNKAFSRIPGIRPLKVASDVYHAYHLYVLCSECPSMDRGAMFTKLREEGIEANVHYIPVHLHPYYQKRFGCRKGQYPNAEKAYERIISLPIFPRMHDLEVKAVIDAVIEVTRPHAM